MPTVVNEIRLQEEPKGEALRKGKLVVCTFWKIYIAVKSTHGPLNVFIILCTSGFSCRKARSLDVAVTAS